MDTNDRHWIKAGIGFTDVNIYLSELAFTDPLMKEQAKMAI